MNLAQKPWWGRIFGLWMAVLISGFLTACGGGGSSTTPAPVPVAVPVNITAQPADQSVVAGASASFSISATGDGVSYQWQRSTDAGVTWANITGSTGASLQVTTTDISLNNSKYRALVNGTAGNVTSAAVTLTVNPPPTAAAISSQPVGITVTAGTAANFSAQATGTAPLTYQWQRDGVNIAGATAATFLLPAPVAADSGATFRIVVSNPAGSVTSADALLTVADAVALPAITAQPQAASTVDGSPVVLSIAVSGTGPFSYQWQRNGAALAGATASSYSSPALTLADSGVLYSVVVSNGAGDVTSANAAITVNPLPVALSGQPANASVTSGQTATFTVTATGSAPIAYQWRRNGTAVAGATAASFTTPATALADSGALYTVLVSNAANTVTSNAATLTVNVAAVAPAIATAPVSQTVSEGQPATFTVVASGTAPLAFQWRRNAVDIAGATAASYTTAATILADSTARFSVRVTNAAGNATSADSVLTVQAATSPLIGRAWTTGVPLETDDNAVRDRRTGIDDAGRAIIVFRKSNGTRDVVYATRGTPNAAGQAPAWSTPVAIDVLGGSAVSTMGTSADYDLVVAPGGNAIAWWYHNAKCAAATYITNLTATCRYYYLARFNASAGTWSAPELIGDAPAPKFNAFFNDRGDIAFIGNSWVRSGTSSYTGATGLYLRQASETTFRLRLLNTEPIGSYVLDLDAAGNLLLAAEYQQNATTDLVAYRGTVADGLGAPQVLDTRAAAASLVVAKVGLNGQQAVLWTQNNGTATTTFAATATTPSAAFTVTDLSFVPGSNLSYQQLFVTDSGQVRYIELGFFGRFRFDGSAALGWGPKTLVPDELSNATLYASDRRGDILAYVNTGAWGTYDGERNLMVRSLSTNTPYILGVSSSAIGAFNAALSINGVGVVSMLNKFDVLPTPTVPAGDGRTVANLWGAFLK